MPTFLTYPLTPGLLANLSSDPFPTQLTAWGLGSTSLPAGGTHFGFVDAGPSFLLCASGTFTLLSGMYFAVPHPLRIEGGRGLLMTCLDQQAFFHLGGPIEPTGRLRYIDGCSDSLLIPPVRRGDACLNLLHLPPGTKQTPHTHPSLRVGLIVRGHGHCLTDDGRHPLAPGQAFVLRANGTHCFHTNDSDLLVVAYHPDSDFGPTDEDHPMINRTFVQEGRS